MKFLRRIKEGIINIVDWLPVVWRDRDWDQAFLYEVLRFKLGRMERFQRERGHSVEFKGIAGEIGLCVKLLDRIIKDDYLVNALNPHERKWGEAEITHTPIEGSEYVSIDVRVLGLEGKYKELEEAGRLSRYHHSDYMRRQDIDMLFDTMKRYVECWWD